MLPVVLWYRWARAAKEMVERYAPFAQRCLFGQRGIGICQGQLETTEWTLDMQMLSACTDTSA